MKTTQPGFIAILTVIMLLSFSVALIYSAGYLSIGASKGALTLASGAAAHSLVDACAEDALLLSRRDGMYEGGNSEYLGGTCRVHVVKDGDVWTLDISGTKDGFTRAIEITFSYVPGPPSVITLQRWLE